MLPLRISRVSRLKVLRNGVGAAEMKKPKLTVIGSLMMDLVVRTSRIPVAGETVIGTSFGRFPGGKGANQAVAAARLGAVVTMIGKAGADDFGREMRGVLKQEQVDVGHVLEDEHNSTGVAFIMVDESGENRIVIVPGANLAYSLRDLCAVESIISSSDLIMMQMEIDMPVIEAGVALAHKHGVPIILDPAPAKELPDKVLSRIAYLTPNETETEILTGIKVTDVVTAKEGAQELLAKGVQNVVITLGEKGVLVANQRDFEYIPGYNVESLDTVAAGDAFNGALAVGIARAKSLRDATRFANAAGALAVTKSGAIPSLPTTDEVAQFLKSGN